MAGEIGEILLEELGIAMEMAYKRGHDILNRPSGHHTVEPHDDESREHAHVAHAFPRPGSIGTRGIGLCTPSQDELTEHGRHTQRHDAAQINKDKGCSAVLPGLVGEPPDVAKPDGRTSRCQYDSQAGCKCAAMFHHLYLYAKKH